VGTTALAFGSVVVVVVGTVCTIVVVVVVVGVTFTVVVVVVVGVDVLTVVVEVVVGAGPVPLVAVDTVVTVVIVVIVGVVLTVVVVVPFGETYVQLCMAERAWEDIVMADGAATVVVVTGSVVFVLEGGAVAGVSRFLPVVGVGPLCVFSLAGAERGLSPFEGLSAAAALGLVRCPPPTPARRAAMTAPTNPNDAKGVRMRDRRDRVRACLAAGLASCFRPCVAMCTREVDGKAGWAAVASISSKPMCSLILRAGVE
jgi:hypothetical protein